MRMIIYKLFWDERCVYKQPKICHIYIYMSIYVCVYIYICLNLNLCLNLYIYIYRKIRKDIDRSEGYR